MALFYEGNGEPAEDIERADFVDFLMVVAGEYFPDESAMKGGIGFKHQPNPLASVSGDVEGNLKTTMFE